MAQPRPNAQRAWSDLLSTALQFAEPSQTIAQLATTRTPTDALPNRPTSRSINIRTFKQPNTITFVTDTRSSKVSELTHSPHAELCWHAAHHNLQFRLSGSAHIRTDAAQEWQALTPRERAWWTWPTPRQTWAGPHVFNAPLPAHMPDTFCVCELVVDFVDLLDLCVAPFHREEHYLRDGQWAVRRVNP